MSYTKKVWKTGDTITADAMNNIENSVEESSELYDVSWSDTLEWDGNTEGLHEIKLASSCHYKISNQILTLQQLEHCKYVFNGETTPFVDLEYLDENFETVSDVSQASLVADANSVVLIALKDFSTNVLGDNIVFEKGLYFACVQIPTTGKPVYVSKMFSSDGAIFKTTKIKGTFLPQNQGTLILAFDNDYYLYHDGADVTDTNNRIKRDVIVDAINKGVQIWVRTSEEGVYYYVCSMFYYNETFAAIVYAIGQNIIPFYTAEYTKSS